LLAKSFQLNIAMGLHLRPAGMLCDCARKYKCRVLIKYKDDGEADAKSILSVLGAGLIAGDKFEIICSGDDEEEAMSELTSLVESGFGEE